MTVSASAYKNNGLNLFTAFFIGFLSIVGLQGCSSSSSTTPVVADQDASGIFKSGTAELNSGATMLNDLRAFVHNGRIIVFSVSGHLLFDGQITGITGDDYTATVDVYEAGLKTQSTVAVTGKVTSESQITGTITGTGDASGTFTLTFDTAYNTPATEAIAIIHPDDWEGDLLSQFSFAGETPTPFDNTDMYDNTGSIGIAGSIKDSNNVQICEYLGTVTIPDSTINIYSFNLSAPNSAFNQANCTDFTFGQNFTGLNSVLSETGTQKDLIIAFTDGTQAVFGVLTQP